MRCDPCLCASITLTTSLLLLLTSQYRNVASSSVTHRNSVERFLHFLKQHWQASIHNFVETLQTACDAGAELVLDWIPADVAKRLVCKFRRMAEYAPLFLTVEGLLCEVGRGLRASDPSESFRRMYATAYGHAALLPLSDEEHVVCIPSIVSPGSRDIHRECVPAGDFEVV